MAAVPYISAAIVAALASVAALAAAGKARRYGRNPLAWFVITLAIGPVYGNLLLLAIGPTQH